MALEREAEANAASALFWLDYLAGARYRPLPGLAEEGPRRMAAVRVDVPADSLSRLRALAERSGLPCVRCCWRRMAERCAASAMPMK
ncbi:hypothetical protein P4114_23975 [Pseudomonas aeruginosa]|nr:hypothetical protein [Pseudomonas aeruginosa]